MAASSAAVRPPGRGLARGPRKWIAAASLRHGVICPPGSTGAAAAAPRPWLRELERARFALAGKAWGLGGQLTDKASRGWAASLGDYTCNRWPDRSTAAIRGLRVATFLMSLVAATAATVRCARPERYEPAALRAGRRSGTVDGSARAGRPGRTRERCGRCPGAQRGSRRGRRSRRRSGFRPLVPLRPCTTPGFPPNR